MIYQHLYSRFNRKSYVTAAIIGSGHFGTAVITQSMHNPLLKVPVVCDQNVNRAREAYGKAGVTGDMLVVCESVATAKVALEQGKYVIVADPMIVMELPINVIGESTGIPEAGARHALAAIQHGKHVAMINKEADSAVGPILQHLAEKAGVVYTPVDGDQHGLLIGMFYWAKTLGLNVICGGKARDAEFILDRKKKTVTCEADGITVHETKVVQLTDDDLDLFDELPAGKEAEYMERRKSLLAELPMAGGFDLCELTIMCNSTGLAPDIPATHEPIVRIAEIPKILCVREDGGILKKPGSIEVVTVFRDSFESGLGGGEFIVVASPNEYSQMILTTKGCISNAKGTAALVHRPHHLCGVEASTSILCAGVVGITTGSSDYLPHYDLVRTAAVDLKAGYKLGTDHDKNLKSAIVPANPISGKAAIPAHLASGNELVCDVTAGTAITYDMVKWPENSVLWDLREQQDKLFLQK